MTWKACFFPPFSPAEAMPVIVYTTRALQRVAVTGLSVRRPRLYGSGTDLLHRASLIRMTLPVLPDGPGLKASVAFHRL